MAEYQYIYIFDTLICNPRRKRQRTLHLGASPGKTSEETETCKRLAELATVCGYGIPASSERQRSVGDPETDRGEPEATGLTPGGERARGPGG